MVINHRRNMDFDCTRPQSQMIPFSSFLRVGSNRTSTQRNGIKTLTIGNPRINPRFPRTLELECQFKLERERVFFGVLGQEKTGVASLVNERGFI